ncbi:MAG TPA: heavy metal translocating P-type ATPase metal-binding domain-containing protein, partial [Desulfobacterales bacterium]|nr:heavy metal translocating P-type ATPase metal-binding domain-containing protein [Desulfobacterales bacterium]
MPTSRPLTTRPEAARRACDLCGAPVGSAAVEAVFEAETRRFCCTGCRQVYAILLQAAGSA